ncbi:formate dehydrogenase accessory protein FdhE [Pseudomonas azotifigens]|uniref:Formate dehydrogenase accessory protein FdhE n=2 Tax=Stutzerimonas azotifigens TaxID=291995 RepID=A0ABR5Z1K8_9GAMM|nr:formate dehydrogenase accessory protein FdhE [Stutzerimonas azotifigens]
MDPPTIALPDAQVFSRRAARLRELVVMVPALDEFLSFMARVVQAQDQALQREPRWQPEAGAFDLALEHGMPPLGVDALRRDLDWKQDLTALLDAIELHVGERQRPLIQTLRDMSPEQLDALADEVIDVRPGTQENRGLMPLVAAALQVAWVRLARQLPRPPKRPSAESRGVCPCCGSLPVASVVHNERHRSGVRYLHCSLCSTEWHLERVRCSVCDSGAKLTYLGLDDEKGKPFLPIQAEACGECHSYLKVAQRELHGRAEPVADDLASLGLDLLLAEQGEFARSGYNPLLILGD